MTTETIIHIGNTVFEERDINPSQLGITSRQINYWISQKIIPFASAQVTKQTIDSNLVETKKASKTKWIKLNLAQAVWASIVNELINFKVSTETLKVLAYKVWQEPRETKQADKRFEYHIKHNPNNLSEYEISKLKNHLKNEMLMEHYFRTIINGFTDMLKSALYRKELPHNFLYVPSTGDYLFHSGSKELILNLQSVYLQQPMISIPIVPILSKVLLVDFDNRKKKNLDYLNNVEKQIRDIVVFKRPKIVEIAFEEGNIETITVTEDHKTREQLAEYILNNKIKKGSKLLLDVRVNDEYKITLIKKNK